MLIGYRRDMKVSSIDILSDVTGKAEILAQRVDDY